MLSSLSLFCPNKMLFWPSSVTNISVVREVKSKGQRRGNRANGRVCLTGGPALRASCVNATSRLVSHVSNTYYDIILP